MTEFTDDSINKTAVMRHFPVIVVSLVTLVSLFLIYREYYLSPYLIFDDQRNVINSLKAVQYGGFTDAFYRAPLFYLLYLLGIKLFSAQIVLKYFVLLTLPLSVYYVYRIGLHLTQKRKRSVLHATALTLLLMAFYQIWLLAGHHKSITLPLLFGVIYFVMTDRDRWAFFILLLLAFIYPPHLIIGLGFLLSYRLLGEYRKWQDGAGEIPGLLKEYSLKSVLPAFLLVAFYAAYFAVAILGNIPDFTGLEQTLTQQYPEIPGEVVQQIESVRPDFIPRPEQVFGVIPLIYLNDIRIGLFGLMGGYQLWFPLLLILLGIVLIQGRNFIIRDSILALLFTGIFLYVLAHLLYPNLYLPNRYTLFTLPLAVSAMIVQNVGPALRRIIHWIRQLPQLLVTILGVVFGVVAIYLFYQGIWHKNLYFGSEYNRLEFYLFSMIVIALLGLILFVWYVRREHPRQEFSSLSASFVSLALILVLILAASGYPAPMKFQDEKLIRWIESLPGGKKFCGYPYEMDTIQAITESHVVVNLGQRRTNRDALEFYRFLNGYYATDYTTVRQYVETTECDYLILNPGYFSGAPTEDNSLFAFYEILEAHEDSLRKRSGFFLNDPPLDMIVFESSRHIVISADALTDYATGTDTRTE